jgi:hypothetical protein
MRKNGRNWRGRAYVFMARQGGGVAGFRSIVLAGLLAAVSCCALAADPPGTITILEGEAQIFRGISRFVAVEGAKLAFGDIVETGDNTFIQVELSDGSTLQMGGISRAMLNGGTGRPKPERWVYFMNGWGKVSGARRDPKADAPYDLRAPLFEIAPNAGTVVFQATPIDLQLFVERGDVRLTERQRAGAASNVALKLGDTYTRKAVVGKGVVVHDPSPEFLAKVPRNFRDTLPSRMEKFRDREIKMKEAPDFGYADVELWLKAEPTIRRPFVQRWKAKAFKDSAFKSGIVANMSSHPEWDPVLFPEKYLPKDPPSTPAATTAVAPGMAPSATVANPPAPSPTK